MNAEAPTYGLWTLVVLNAAIFIVFAFSFTKPHTARDWRSLGAFSAFLVALFTEMYGFPLTIYLLFGWRVVSPAWTCSPTTVATCGRRSSA